MDGFIIVWYSDKDIRSRIAYYDNYVYLNVPDMSDKIVEYKCTMYQALGLTYNWFIDYYVEDENYDVKLTTNESYKTTHSMYWEKETLLDALYYMWKSHPSTASSP